MKKLIATCLFILAAHLSDAQHTLVLKSGEKMNGEVQSLKDGNISFLFKGNVMNMKVSEISAIYFEDKGSPGTGEVKASTTTPGTKGVSYVMTGRKLINQPKVDNLTQEKGIVVVAVNIDKYGHVKKAEPGAEGTTTNSNYLLTKAKQAAESAIFDNCATCPLDTKGTITIIF
jgi:hypothetical protein